MRRRREGREGEEPGRHEPVGAVDEEGDAVVVHEVGDEEGAGQDFVEVEQPAGVLDLDGEGRRKRGKIRIGLEKRRSRREKKGREKGRRWQGKERRGREEGGPGRVPTRWKTKELRAIGRTKAPSKCGRQQSSFPPHPSLPPSLHTSLPPYLHPKAATLSLPTATQHLQGVPALPDDVDVRDAHEEDSAHLRKEEGRRERCTNQSVDDINPSDRLKIN